MKKLFALLFLLFAVQVHAQHIDPTNTVPSSNSSFLANLQNFLKNEDANRYSELGFPSVVISGGTHSTGAGLTKTPTSLIAYPGGYRITEAGSIVYPDNSTCYVIANYATTGNTSTFVRVSGTHYLIDCTSVSEPALPANSVRLMTVTTSGGSVSAVTDRRSTGVVAVTNTGAAIGDLLYGDATTSLARLADVATGNALISGGVGAAPSWGKIGLTTHVSGILGSANGGTGNGFTKFTGPGSAEKTFTLPDADATILTSQTAWTRSYWFAAQNLVADGTECADPALVTINSGARRYTIICADNDGSTVYGELAMPDTWDGGTVTLMGAFVQTAADTSALAAGVVAACRKAADAINNTWSASAGMNIAAMAGSNKLDTVTTGAITPNGTCTGTSRLLQFRWQMSASGTTTAVATLHLLGFKLEYGVTGFSE